MAYPMIALTTEGTSFACASISLTETGLAVLDENGSRIGFVPYDSLSYVAPTEESRIKDAPMRVRTEDGSTFGAAAISQATAGIAVLDPSGARVGFVPYDSLTHVLPEAKTGPTLPADATPVDGVAIQEEDDGGSPVWAGDEERASDDEESGDDGGSDDGADESGDDNDSDPDGSGDGEEDGAAGDDADADDGEEDTDEAPDPEDRDVGTDGPIWGGEPVEQTERGGDADGGAEASTSAETETEGSTETEADAAADADAEADGEQPGSPDRRESAEESELVVEWSFGDE